MPEAQSQQVPQRAVAAQRGSGGRGCFCSLPRPPSLPLTETAQGPAGEFPVQGPELRGPAENSDGDTSRAAHSLAQGNTSQRAWSLVPGGAAGTLSSPGYSSKGLGLRGSINTGCQKVCPPSLCFIGQRLRGETERRRELQACFSRVMCAQPRPAATLTYLIATRLSLGSVSGLGFRVLDVTFFALYFFLGVFFFCFPPALFSSG